MNDFSNLTPEQLLKEIAGELTFWFIQEIEYGECKIVNDTRLKDLFKEVTKRYSE